jgi:hypothetical protein
MAVKEDAIEKKLSAVRDVQSQPQLVRFGAFEADLRKFWSGCLRFGDSTIE